MGNETVLKTVVSKHAKGFKFIFIKPLNKNFVLSFAIIKYQFYTMRSLTLFRQYIQNNAFGKI